MLINIDSPNKEVILALGAESAGNFSVSYKGQIFFSEDFGDLLDEVNFDNYKKSLFEYLKINNLKPDVIVADLHPLYVTTSLGKELAKKYNTKFIQTQHHLAHLFSTVGDKLAISNKQFTDTVYNIPNTIYGIIMDGTGYGLDENIWGGEVFSISDKQLTVNRVGHLEEQVMIGGDLAVKEPARMLFSIMSKFLNKNELQKFMEKFYTTNESELLYNQLHQNFNCQTTTSTGRVLDAVAVMLGIAKNERPSKHYATEQLTVNSSPEKLLSKISAGKQLTNIDALKPKIDNDVLNTTCLVEYIYNNLDKDAGELATLAQLYIAEGLYEIIGENKSPLFISGGLSKTKIINDYLVSKGAYSNQKIPAGDAGISFGQLIFYLSS